MPRPFHSITLPTFLPPYYLPRSCKMDASPSSNDCSHCTSTTISQHHFESVFVFWASLSLVPVIVVVWCWFMSVRIGRPAAPTHQRQTSSVRPAPTTEVLPQLEPIDQQQKIPPGDVTIDIVEDISGYQREVECAICLTDAKESPSSPPWMWAVLPCRHMFHCDCIKVWLVMNRTCPLCRNQVPPFPHS